MIHRMLSVMYLEWDIEWESSMAVAIFTVLLIGFILGGSTVYLVENHLRTNEMNKIYKLTESLINGNELDGSDIGKETIYSKTTNQLIRLQEILEGRRKEAEKSKYEIQKLISEIAHQLRTPLANIKNYTELLQESLNETQETLNTEYIKDFCYKYGSRRITKILCCKISSDDIDRDASRRSRTDGRQSNTHV